MPTNRPKARTSYICQECGNESPRWMGRCPACGQWNTLVERAAPVTRAGKATPAAATAGPQALAAVRLRDERRIALGMEEFNRVLGGGIVPGAVMLLSGDPGVGKSTLLLQIAALAGQRGPVLYISGEESAQQIKLRADRMGVDQENVQIVAETNLDAVLQWASSLEPVLMIVDSIQTMQLDQVDGAPGSVVQIRDATVAITRWAKERHVPVFLVGHVTKEGAIAGPKLLEHIVDVVLYLEGERFSSYRLLRGMKNRFGPTHETGVFEMQSEGMREVSNPSALFLAEHPDPASGIVVVPTMEGTRPILVEVQALTTPTVFGLPRRTANGVELNRLHLVLAVLTKRARLALSSQDVFVNIVGGLQIEEPAADLAMALAVASSYRDRALAPGLVAIGEVGLSGELRRVPQMERRIAEAVKLGFTLCLMPPTHGPFAMPTGMQPIYARTVDEALRAVFS